MSVPQWKSLTDMKNLPSCLPQETRSTLRIQQDASTPAPTMSIRFFCNMQCIGFVIYATVNIFNVILNIKILQVDKRETRMPSQEYAGVYIFYGSVAVTVKSEVHLIYHAY